MRKITLSFWGVLALLTLAWLLSAGDFSKPVNFIAVRNYLVQYTGVIAIGAMSIAVLLATRARWLEPFLGGLDKGYRLHKWLGITTAAAGTLHWVAANGPRWLIELGLWQRGERAPRPDPDSLMVIERFFREQRGTAEQIGEWAFYIAIVLLVLALVKRFPYRLFAKTHWLIALGYFALVWHTLVLTKFSYWSEPVGMAIAVLLLIGTISSVLLILKVFGYGKRIIGTIDKLEYFPEHKVLETSLQLDDGWPGHKAGQFAFVTHDPKEGQHPFTIGSAWNPEERKIVFITKALGDYTRQLPSRLKVGDKVEVEGPYGRFTFEDDNARQIWIGAGIGITPFVARLKALAKAPHQQQIDLFHPVAVYEKEPLEQLEADAKEAGVRLHILVANKDGKLDGDRLRSMVPGWRKASIWFCGPSAFGASLRNNLKEHGLKSQSFHQELFEMR
ncbi:ferric reductase-like transmembrane domain-containing protein [Aestuariirhabdus sp. Z084]|uniref:ferredoxin reductase family protein n=1 Tax=Aestuariirhabdus haliotis TaxID=2918751 RepID=UPI00201B3EA9|nr:ferric reductase-like transmembrane domain-containing protein [Aestuariirhabdus haliotis]MCL6415019.1 ferric reductase-like transmembrane domain-containing protein [Aestuariirhabdus haliotis]MCL6418951.1 ferric reductase-like transmembrane domain-containing protein [Aestuariirhabdus haliotis]